ncbi:PAAR domain-containing protein [Cupriavidus sp. BIC8F]|uniref:PAAR domain-containing protein n=1 Tax=Cupriavidus sp. BIC8F TaxID=3079014 RepID=UPI0029163A49|nr:PAAR domain-containing protein [Cupriavidus sp. BIC8F]
MVTRTYLIKGDKADNGAMIIGGSPSSSYDGIPTAREGDPVYCPVCKRTGVIVCVGPRWPSSDDGKEEALSGDICACACNPPPVFHASRPNTMTMTAEDAAQWNRSYAPSSAGSPAISSPLQSADNGRFNDKYVIREANGSPMPRTAYAIERQAGGIEYGETDEQGQTHLLSSVEEAETIRVYIAG